MNQIFAFLDQVVEASSFEGLLQLLDEHLQQEALEVGCGRRRAGERAKAPQRRPSLRKEEPRCKICGRLFARRDSVTRHLKHRVCTKWKIPVAAPAAEAGGSIQPVCITPQVVATAQKRKRCEDEEAGDGKRRRLT
ncbi:hypothetical protein BC832DRAFT_591198 [Gaertneriomyces semiglobifer]|nr:hypothetical protein BC832DRAFT_591198 [Gaertneriomyces semiglobifer]